MTQTDQVVDIVRSVFGDDLLGAYLYGSSVVGGLKPRSDLDVLVVSGRPSTDAEKRALIDALLPISGRRAVGGPARSLEVTIVVQSEVRPWRYPPPMDFQYGDWFRGDFEAGGLAPWDDPNPDVAVLLTTVLLANRALSGPDVRELVDEVPADDLRKAMLAGIPGLLGDLEGDEANVLLTLARIWATLATGAIQPKDAAADWALARLPERSRGTLAYARDVYLGRRPDEWSDLAGQARADASVLVTTIRNTAG